MIKNKIGEHVIVPDLTFQKPTLINGEDVGKIALKSGKLVKIYVKIQDNISNNCSSI